MSEFVRDYGRYVVIKLSELDLWQGPALRQLLKDFEIPVCDGVFVEEDWDIYEDVWKLVEKESGYE